MSLCICQMIKDEQLYIEEWIEYHHNLGFDKFYLIEDYCSSSHKNILKKYDYVELYKLLDIINNEERIMLYNKVHRQRIIYHIFERLWRNKHNWLAFIDVDEYIDLDKESLNKILNDNINNPVVTLEWKNMECNENLLHPNN